MEREKDVVQIQKKQTEGKKAIVEVESEAVKKIE